MLPERNRVIFFYDLFQLKTSLVTSVDVVTFSEVCRFDARATEILVQFLASCYEGLNPQTLRTLNHKVKHPQVLCSLLDWAELLVTDPIKKKSWRLFKRFIQSDIRRAQFQSFHVGLWGINSKKSQIQIKRNLIPFEKWGFYGDEIPINSKHFKPGQTLLSAQVRKDLLSELLARSSVITVQDYIDFLEHCIHPRQAERDLKSFPKIKFVGNTKGRRYFLTSKRSIFQIA